MKGLIFISLLFLASCKIGSPGEGRVVGKLVDISWEGLFFKSCEVGVQYGTDSSKIEFLSSKNQALCQDLEKIVGEVISVKYDVNLIVFFVNQPEIISSYEKVEPK